MAFVSPVEDGFGLLDLFGGDYDDEADAHVEGAEHFVLLDVAQVLEVFEERWDCPGGEVNDCAHALGDDAGKIFGDASAGDVGHTVDQFRAGELLDDGEVAAVYAHESRAGLVFELIDVLLGPVFAYFEEELAGERVAVGVEAVGGQTNEDVADLDGFAGNDFVAGDGSDDGSGEIVLVVGIEAGHLGGFAADEGAAVGAAGFAETLDDGLDGGVVELAGGEVVEEEERGRALYGDVVDAVVDEVLADGVVDAQFEGDLQFCAYAVHRGDEYGIWVLLEVEGEEAAEAADLGEDVLVEGLAGEHFDALLAALGAGDVDACIGVADGLLLRCGGGRLGFAGGFIAGGGAFPLDGRMKRVRLRCALVVLRLLRLRGLGCG